jgi:hypothetical protein
MLPVDASAGLNQFCTAGERDIFRGGLKCEEGTNSNLERTLTLRKLSHADPGIPRSDARHSDPGAPPSIAEVIQLAQRFGSCEPQIFRQATQAVLRIELQLVSGPVKERSRCMHPVFCWPYPHFS